MKGVKLCEPENHIKTDRIGISFGKGFVSYAFMSVGFLFIFLTVFDGISCHRFRAGLFLLFLT